MDPILEKGSLSNEEDAETVSVNLLSFETVVCPGGYGGQDSRKLDLKSPLGKLLIVLTAPT